MGLLEVTSKQYYDDGFSHGSYQFTRLDDELCQKQEKKH